MDWNLNLKRLMGEATQLATAHQLGGFAHQALEIEVPVHGDSLVVGASGSGALRSGAVVFSACARPGRP